MTEFFLMFIGIFASIIVLGDLYCLAQKKEVTSTLTNLATNAVIYGIIAGMAVSLALN